MTITTAGTTIDGKTINGDLRVKAGNVTIKNSVVNGDVRIDAGDDDAGYSFTIQDSEVNAGDALGNDAYDGTGIGAIDFTALRVDVHGGKRGINCFLKCTVRDSWVHGQATDSTGVTHEAAIRMGDTSTIVHNSLVCDAPNVAPEAGCSAALTGYGDFAPVQNNLIQNNYFLSETSGAGACAYGGSSAGKPYSDATNHIVFKDNVFGLGATDDQGRPNCAYYFAVTDFDTSAPGNVWTNNVYTNGAVVNP